MQWYIKVLKNYVGFDGRAHRTEFWMFTLVSILIALALSFIDKLIGFETLGLRSLYNFAILLPAMAVGMRRLHDTDRSGWWILLYFIPILGWIPLIIFFCIDGTPGTNQYGPDPKHSDAELI